jgi:hypothetical protein
LKLGFNFLDVSVGILSRVHGQFLPVEIIIGVKFLKPEISPEKIFKLYPALPEGQLGSIVKLCMGIQWNTNGYEK